MQRTTGIESDAIGKRKTLLWEAFEIGLAAQAIGASGSVTGEPIYAEGFEHFHVYVSRDNASVSIEVRVIPVLPVIQAAPPVNVADFLVGTWAVAGTVPLLGVFYFGRELALTASGKTWRFGPLFRIRIVNLDGVNPVTVSAHVHCQG